MTPADDVRKLREILGILAGHASLCWNPKPTGEFDSAEASRAVDMAYDALAVLELGQVPKRTVSAAEVRGILADDAATAERAREDQSDCDTQGAGGILPQEVSVARMGINHEDMPHQWSSQSRDVGESSGTAGDTSQSDPQSSLDSSPEHVSGPSQEGARRASSDGPNMTPAQEALLREADESIEEYMEWASAPGRPISDLLRDLARELRAALADTERLLALSKMIPSETWERLTGHWPTSDGIDEYRAAIDAAREGQT